MTPVDPGESFEKLTARCWWLCGPNPAGVMPYTTIGWLTRLGKGFPNNWYPFGCNDSRHHGRDIGGAKSKAEGAPIYSWGRCVVRLNSYDPGGYARYIQVYFPDANWSLTLGHLLNGSAYPVGTWFEAGDLMARIGTREDGILNSHVHLRSAPGDWRKAIDPCSDHDPLILWRKLGLPA